MEIEDYKKYEPIDGVWYFKRRLGSGAYGTVFEIERHDMPEMRAALKIITIPQSQSEIDSYKRDNFSTDDSEVSEYFYSFVEAFRNEIRIMMQLSGNSNIVSYMSDTIIKHETGIGWDVLIRMELLTPASEYFAVNRPDEENIARLGIDICKALEVCAKHNIVHRDIKPANIFISELGDFKLGDFGVARTFENSSGMLSKKGTPTFMAPEVFRTEPYGATADIYSLGMMMHRLLNNNLDPFVTRRDFKAVEEATIRRMSGEALPPPENAGEELSRIILKACAYDAWDRYETPEEMRRELEAFLSEKTAETDAEDSAENEAQDDSSAEPAADAEAQAEPADVVSEEINADGSEIRETAAVKKLKGKHILIIAAAVLAAVIGITAIFMHGRRGRPVTDMTVAENVYHLAKSGTSYDNRFVIGNDNISRSSITAVEFVDTLKDAPADKWDVSEEGNGTVYSWVSKKNGTVLYFGANGKIAAPDDSSCLFENFENMRSISLDNFVTSEATDMDHMFANCKALTSLDLTGFDTAKTTDMSFMFSGCSSLTSLDLSSFDTSDVTDMSRMFFNCTALTSLDLNSFDTGKVTDMSYMFSNCAHIKRLDLGSFETADDTDIRSMFSYTSDIQELIVTEKFIIPKGENTEDIFYKSRMNGLKQSR